MLESKKNSVYNRAIKKWGVPIQIVVAIEELSELQKELTKELRYCEKLDTIAEEMADVEIVLEQLKIIFNNKKVVESYKKHKIKRLEKLINKKDS